MMNTMTTNDCLELLLQPMADSFSVEFARRLVDLRAAPDVQQRLEQLAEKANEGTLTVEEHTEYKAFIDSSTMIAIMQAKARRFLAQHVAKNGPRSP
jgi:hypothetical protein